MNMRACLMEAACQSTVSTTPGRESNKNMRIFGYKERPSDACAETRILLQSRMKEGLFIKNCHLCSARSTQKSLRGVVGYHMRLTRARSRIRTPPQTLRFFPTLGPLHVFFTELPSHTVFNTTFFVYYRSGVIECTPLKAVETSTTPVRDRRKSQLLCGRQLQRHLLQGHGMLHCRLVIHFKLQTETNAVLPIKSSSNYRNGCTPRNPLIRMAHEAGWNVVEELEAPIFRR